MAVALVLILVGGFVIYFSLGQMLAGLDQDNPGGLVPVRVSHWAGYLVSLDIQNRSEGVSSISASWIVPEVKVSENNTFSSVWVGIGGYGEQSLIQAGTEQQCVDGKLEYFAWYELLPYTITTVPSLNIQPGHSVTVSINLLNDNESTWLLSLTDVTNGRHFQKNVFYNSTRKSAEWVVERPMVKGVISTLADFGNATINNCTATINGVTGSVSDFIYSPVIMVDSNDTELTSVLPLNSDGSSFTVSYLNPYTNSTSNTG